MLQDKKASSKGGYDNRVTMRDFDLVVAELVVKGKLQIRNGIRWDDKKKKWVKTGGAGRWILGEPRTLRNILQWYEKWMAETGGDEDKLK